VIYIPFVYLRALGLFGLVVLMIVGTAGILRWAEVRNNGVALLVGIVAALTSLYLAWVGWEHRHLQRAEFDVSFTYLLLRPWEVVNLALMINETGTWSIGRGSKEAVSGWALAVVWAIEAGAILLCIPYFAAKGMAAHSYCERCQKWCTDRQGVLSLSMADPVTLRRELETGNVGHLGTIPPWDTEAPERLRVDLSRCPTCDHSHLFSVSQVTVSIDGKGNRSEKVVPIVNRLYVAPEHAQWLLDYRGRLDAASMPDRLAPTTAESSPPPPVPPASA
jgi:hypothetical protein